MKAALVDPSRVDETIAHLPPGLAKYAWSATHTTFSPNMCRAGVKTNVIPDAVDIEVDIRTIPGDNEDEVRRHLDKALGDLSEDVIVEKLFSKQASVSPTGTPLWDVLGRVVDAPLSGRQAAAAADRRLHRRAVLPRARRDRLRLRPVLARR